MSELTERNKDIVRQVLAAMTASDFEALSALLDDDVTWTVMANPEYCRVGGEFNGKARFMEFFKSTVGSFDSGLALHPLSMIAEGDCVATEAQSEGKSPAGTYSNRYHFAMELRDGKVVSAREYMDSALVVAFTAQAKAHYKAQMRKQ